VAGAVSPGEVKGILSELGFKDVTITPKERSEEIIRAWNVVDDAEKVVFSAYIEAVKPESKEGQAPGIHEPVLSGGIKGGKA
jgi:hypothetical protein